MRYHYVKPSIYLSKYVETYTCDHPVYNVCTLFKIRDKGLAIVQQRINSDTKLTWWSDIDPWLTDELYLHPWFRACFDERASEATDGLYPMVTVRQIMLVLKMKPLNKKSMGNLFR